MLDFLSNITNTYLNPIGIWIGIITAIPIFWTWYDIVWGRQHRREKIFRQLSRLIGTMPVILIVDLLPGKDVRATVEHFCTQDAGLRAIPKERLFTVRRDTWLRPEDAPLLVKEVRDAAAEILHCGADVVHCFYAGPVFAAATIGAEFANASCRVILYQNEQGKYVNFGPLRHPGF